MKLGTGARSFRSSNVGVRSLIGSPNRTKMGTGLRFFRCPERLQATPSWIRFQEADIQRDAVHSGARNVAREVHEAGAFPGRESGLSVYATLLFFFISVDSSTSFVVRPGAVSSAGQSEARAFVTTAACIRTAPTVCMSRSINASSASVQFFWEHIPSPVSDER